MSNLSVAPADIVSGTVQIVSAFVSRNEIPHDRVANLVRSVAHELCTSVAGAGLAFAGADTAPQAIAAASAAPLIPAAPAAPMIAAPAAEESGVPAAEADAEGGGTVSVPTAAEEAPAAGEPYKFAHLSREPAIPVSTSVQNDLVFCLFDGVGKKMLKRYIRAKYGMEDHEYRAHFGLPPEYPLTAPGYSGEKSLVAISQGLGTDRISKVPKSERQHDNVRELAKAA